jgi:hypothetical protein
MVGLDRIPRRRFEPHDFVAVAKKNAGDGKGGAPINRRSAKPSTAALVMNLPVHIHILAIAAVDRHCQVVPSGIHAATLRFPAIWSIARSRRCNFAPRD